MNAPGFVKPFSPSRFPARGLRGGESFSGIGEIENHAAGPEAMRRVHVQSVVPDQFMNRKKWRKLPDWKKSQIKTAIADKKMRDMDRELSAIYGNDFQATQECDLGESNKIVQAGPTRNRLECRPGGRESTKTI